MPVDDLKALAYSQVVNGQHVGTSKPKYKKHLHRPLADPPHLNEPFVNLNLCHAAEDRQRGDGAIERLGGQVLHCGDFLPRKPRAAQFGFIQQQNLFGSGETVCAQRFHTPENRRRRRARELLVHNCPKQALVRVLRLFFLRWKRADFAYHAGKMPVNAAEFSHHEISVNGIVRF